MKTAIFILISSFMIVAVTMIAGCRPQEVKKPLDQVTVQLKWVHQAQFAGIYAADKKGFYGEENISVTLVAGGPEVSYKSITKDLVESKSDFAIVSGDQLLQARSENEPLIAIAAIFQENPYVYVSLRNSGIQRPQDFVGKNLMVSPDGEILHSTLLHKLGIDPNTIDIIPFSRDATPLITGQVDASFVYRTGTALAYDETGYELNYIWVGDYGIHFYADTLITREQLVQQNPELVERFLRATLKGWRYAIENQSEAVDLALQYDPTLTKNRQELMMRTQAPLIHNGKVEIGWMEAGPWQEMNQILLDNAILAKPIDVSKTYTMQFLNKIYGKAE